MIIIPILLALFTWILILWLCGQHKHINIFEQISLWFVSVLSLFVFELFLQWIIFDKLSLLLPILSFVVCLWLFIFKCIKIKWYWKEIMNSIKWNFIDIKNQFKSQKLWQKILVCLFGIYALAKCFMAFSINLHMPTFDEDAVTWRDLKTKVFTENKSLVLDKNSPEYLWSAHDRNLFAPLTDTYFLVANYWNNIGETNILSPIVYLLSTLLLFGIFLRKWNLFFASFSSYIFTSLPFIFIHWFGSYFNFVSWVFMFIFLFYLIDQLLDDNRGMIIPLSLLWFLTTTIRNESYIFMVVIILCVFTYSYFVNKKKNLKNLTKNLRIFISLVIWIVCLKYSEHILPEWTIMNFWWTDISSWTLSTFFDNLFWKWLMNAILQQWFYHPDYNIIWILFFMALIYAISEKISYKKLIPFIIPFIILLFASCAVLIYNYEWLWLVTHYSFVRYSAIYIMFLVFLIIYTIYLIYEKELNK